MLDKWLKRYTREELLASQRDLHCGKNLYRVYRIRDGDGVYASFREYVGDTWAVSKAQAENNVRFNVDGAVPAYRIIGDYAEQGSVCIYYEAELAQ